MYIATILYLVCVVARDTKSNQWPVALLYTCEHVSCICAIDNRVCICAVQDVLVINRTNDTLQNVCLELATLGDLKLCERPQNYTVGPKGKRWIKANIKVSSTETGVIFGNLVYDVAGSSASDKNCVVLNDIHVDIMDYITPATTSEVLYRIMWAEFEWENKVAINSSIRYVSRERESVCVCVWQLSLAQPTIAH
jgi:vesicle coat complex subunit